MASINRNKISSEINQKFTFDRNTLSRVVKDNPKDKIEIIIGDDKQEDFKPQIKIQRWSNEVNFSMRAQEHPDAVIETQGKLIKYITPEYEVHQYELDPGDIGEDGGLEFEWVLPSKPSSNILTATIQTKGLNFYFQPPLTPEEIDEGAERPENVVGSYAVYHATKGGMNDAAGMEYKVGKAFHIYRPKVTDANGNEIWGELNIDEQNGLLTVTIDQTWLDNAVYPVVVDPTFGYTSIGGTTLSPVGATSNPLGLIILTHTAVTGDTVTRISAYGNATAGGTHNNEVGIYTFVSGLPETLIGSEVVGWNSTTPQWWDTSPLSISLSDGVEYTVAYDPQTSSPTATLYFDTHGSNARSRHNTDGSPLPASWVNENLATSIYSIYATYTASGGGAAVSSTGRMTTNLFWGS